VSDVNGHLGGTARRRRFSTMPFDCGSAAWQKSGQDAEEIGEAVEAGVVQDRLVFFEEVHQQIADRLADWAVTVDHCSGVR
jgi:hypothetical protein